MEGMMVSVGAGPIGTSSPTWKLYDNPHFSKCRHNSFHQHHPYNFLSKSKSKSAIHPRKLLALMDSLPDLDATRKQIMELRAELEFERRMRRKVESLNKALSRELAEERKAREAAEDSYKRLANEVTCMREEADRMVKEVDEEKRMLRISEAWREERVQMKLTEARLLMEEKLRELTSYECKPERPKEKEEVSSPKVKGLAAIEGEENGNDGQHRREVENHHIKRGIKGFVEFPRAIRVGATGIGSSLREGRGHTGSANLECQRAQLRVLLRQRSTVASRLVGAAENLVM